jgi:hypothetical protein
VAQGEAATTTSPLSLPPRAPSSSQSSLLTNALLARLHHDGGAARGDSGPEGSPAGRSQQAPHGRRHYHNSSRLTTTRGSPAQKNSHWSHSSNLHMPLGSAVLVSTPFLFGQAPSDRRRECSPLPCSSESQPQPPCAALQQLHDACRGLQVDATLAPAPVTGPSPSGTQRARSCSLCMATATNSCLLFAPCRGSQREPSRGRSAITRRRDSVVRSRACSVQDLAKVLKVLKSHCDLLSLCSARTHAGPLRARDSRARREPLSQPPAHPGHEQPGGGDEVGSTHLLACDPHVYFPKKKPKGGVHRHFH